MEFLKKYINQFVTLKPEFLEILISNIKLETIKKGDYFLNYNQISKKIGWVENGVFRYIYTNDEGAEFTKYFVTEQQFISAIESFNSQKPSTEAIQALTNASYYSLSYDNYIRFFELIPEWGKLVTAITNYSYNQKVKELSPMVVQDARKRYEQFLESQPTIMNRVPLGYIANYLGMTQQSLSRLRRIIVKPSFNSKLQ